jgi:hypothetical protein
MTIVALEVYELSCILSQNPKAIVNDVSDIGICDSIAFGLVFVA